MNGETIRRLDSDDSEDDDWTIPAKRARPTSDDSPSTSSDKVSTSGVSTAGDEIESRPTDLLTSSEVSLVTIMCLRSRFVLCEISHSSIAKRYSGRCLLA